MQCAKTWVPPRGAGTSRRSSDRNVGLPAARLGEMTSSSTTACREHDRTSAGSGIDSAHEHFDPR